MSLQITFLVISILALVLFYLGSGKIKLFLAIALIWIFTIGSMAYSNFFLVLDVIPPRFIWAMLPAVLLCIFFIKRVDSDKINPKFLLAIHALRLPIELVLFGLYKEGKIPVYMTFGGWNFDILMGLSAILLLLYTIISKRSIPKSLFFIWNVIGLCFLFTIAVIGLLSAPLPIQQFALDQPNIAVLMFPYTLLPAFVVPIVLIAHVWALKKIKRLSKKL